MGSSGGRINIPPGMYGTLTSASSGRRSPGSFNSAANGGESDYRRAEAKLIQHMHKRALAMSEGLKGLTSERERIVYMEKLVEAWRTLALRQHRYLTILNATDRLLPGNNT